MRTDQDSLFIASRPPRPPKHPPMTAESRAAQFAPFSALTGLDDTLEDTSQSLLSFTPWSEDMWDCFQNNG